MFSHFLFYLCFGVEQQLASYDNFAPVTDQFFYLNLTADNPAFKEEAPLCSEASSSVRYAETIL